LISKLKHPFYNSKHYFYEMPDTMKSVFLCLLFLFPAIILRAGNTDTILVFSPSMHKNIKCVLITPNNYETSRKKYPVVYLLHGYGGNYSRWPNVAPQLKDKADELQCLFVCPDGGYGSWYFDSPLDSNIRYETFISRELLNHIDSMYKTIPDRNHRAITGLSMGGHGGLYLGIRHKELFGAAGSMSGVVDIRVFPKKWDLKNLLGDSACCNNNWEQGSVMNLVNGLKNHELKLIFDCGLFDILIFSNRNLHQKLMNLHIDHDYIERPGTHNGSYWRNSVDYQLLFFKKFFEESATPQKGKF
jgi:S-formylglutathione hydrolase FrmB